jgi:hypothetical protein
MMRLSVYDTLCSNHIYLKLFPDPYFRVNISNYLSENTAGIIVIFYRRTDYENYDEQTAEPAAMKLDGPDELAAILDDICATIGELLVTNAQLKESMVDDAATDAAREKLDRLRKDTLVAKEKLADIKQRQQHKKELARQRQEHERETKTKQTEGKTSSGMLTLRDAAGKVVGYVRVMKNRTEYFSPTGKLVAREIGGATYDGRGRLASRDRQGMRVLGQSVRK